MIKMLICMICALVVAAVMLQLRQQRLELNFQTNRLHGQIEGQQARLWSQQLQIAIGTAPNAISQTINVQSLKMVPRAPLTGRAANWITAANDNSDAE